MCLRHWMCFIGIGSLLLPTALRATERMRKEPIPLLDKQQSFWNVDPYCLESICACFVAHRDPLSAKRLMYLFPQLSEEDVSVLLDAFCLQSVQNTSFQNRRKSSLQN